MQGQQRDHQQQPAWAAAAQLAASTAVALAACAWGAPSAWAGAAETFAAKCAGCHINGGNVLQPGATLFTEDLQVRGQGAAPEGGGVRPAVCEAGKVGTACRMPPDRCIAAATPLTPRPRPAAQRPHQPRGSVRDHLQRQGQDARVWGELCAAGGSRGPLGGGCGDRLGEGQRVVARGGGAAAGAGARVRCRPRRAQLTDASRHSAPAAAPRDARPQGACTFGARFSDAEVQEQVDYVLERAEAGWKAPPGAAQ
jgi:hypothetical protein